MPNTPSTQKEICHEFRLETSGHAAAAHRGRSNLKARRRIARIAERTLASRMLGRSSESACQSSMEGVPNATLEPALQQAALLPELSTHPAWAFDEPGETRKSHPVVASAADKHFLAHSTRIARSGEELSAMD